MLEYLPKVNSTLRSCKSYCGKTIFSVKNESWTTTDMGILQSRAVVHLLSYVQFLTKSYAGTPDFPSRCPSLVYSADVRCIYKPDVSLIDPENVI